MKYVPTVYGRVRPDAAAVLIRQAGTTLASSTEAEDDALIQRVIERCKT